MFSRKTDENPNGWKWDDLSILRKHNGTDPDLPNSKKSWRCLEDEYERLVIVYEMT